ncbi:MAG: UDP-N-acetylglucosamine 2-epimerase (non-hydrolyzing) [Burkholderiaceae bacterium]
MTRKILLVAGARPNFMKIAPIIRALEKRSDAFTYRLVHTGQHFDRDMSAVFFEELGIPEPDVNLDSGGGSHAEQTAKILTRFEQVCLQEKPDCVVVVGDVNSTLACSIVAKKLQIPVAHVEAGLRSRDMSMPEEINRLVTDAISDWFFVTEPDGSRNLLGEGKDPDKVFFVGHVMVDNLFYQRDRLEAADRAGFVTEGLKSGRAEYGVVTLHRPSNVDDPAALAGIAKALQTVSARLPLIFPVHPRTRSNLEKIGLDLGPNITLTKPLSYMEFLNLWKDARLILTDSGGLQEETTAIGVPCLTLRFNTERPVTVDEGTNELVGNEPSNIIAAAEKVLDGGAKQGRRPELWDGHAAERIVETLDRVCPAASQAA